jgi:LPS sulfotransferase NodH
LFLRPRPAGSLAFAAQENLAMERHRRPVFVLGCHRSGTNLLYDTLLSAGGFAIYRGYLPVYEKLMPKFGSFADEKNRARAVETWLRSEGFRRSGLDANQIRAQLMAECTSGGAFILVVMDAVARSQGAARWAAYNPDSALHMSRIKADIPEALFIHIIRDGRDIALSLSKMGGFQPLPWDRGSRDLLATAQYWKWMVQAAKANGARMPDDYLEIHYEELVNNPKPTLASIGQFLDHPLDYDRIHAAKLGRLSETNSSFREEKQAASGTPVNRWRQRLSSKEVAALEACVGDCLEATGYSLASAPGDRHATLIERSTNHVYPAYLNTKLYLKLRTPVGRWTNLSALELKMSGEPKSV